MIEVQDMRVDYDQVCAVRDLTFTVPTGEIFGLIGPNGAGKTTTLRALTGLVEPTYGEIRLDGVDIREQREEADRIIGFMPDFAPLYEDLTCREFLDLFAASYEIPREQRSPVVEEHLALVDLWDRRDAMTAGLSRGMKQRLMLARTLLPQPRVLLLDEPASGMDPHGRSLLKSILRSQREKGRTVLISSHILAEMSDFCTSVGIMERGQMVLSGPLEEVSARVLGRGTLVMEVVSGREHLPGLLASHSLVGRVQQEGTAVEFAFDGGSEQASELLAGLITAGIRVSSFTRRQGDLEDVFLKVGAREVS